MDLFGMNLDVVGGFECSEGWGLGMGWVNIVLLLRCCELLMSEKYFMGWFCEWSIDLGIVVGFG